MEVTEVFGGLPLEFTPFNVMKTTSLQMIGFYTMIFKIHILNINNVILITDYREMRLNKIFSRKWLSVRLSVLL